MAIFDGEPVRIDAALNYLRQRNIAAEVLKEAGQLGVFRHSADIL